MVAVLVSVLLLDSKADTCKYHYNFEGDWEQRCSRSFQVGCNSLGLCNRVGCMHQEEVEVMLAAEVVMLAAEVEEEVGLQSQDSLRELALRR